MINKNRTVVFYEYKKMEKQYGPDKTMAIINNIIDRLDQENVFSVPSITNEYVRTRAKELYNEILVDFTDDNFRS